MDLGLAGLRCIIAGGSKGLGLATARLLAAEGASVAICGRDVAIVETACAMIGKGTIGAAIELRDAPAYRAWLASTAEAMGGCDIFIPFASAGATASDDDGWRTSLEVDLLAFDYGLATLEPWLLTSACGAAIAIASTAALENPAQAPSYASMKAALIACASAHAQRLAPQGVHVNIVSPGPVQFAGGVWDMIEEHHPDIYAGTRAQIAIGRMGEADEVARLIAFAASPACRYLVGANLVVDGGLTRRVGF